MRIFHPTTPVVPRLPPYICVRQDTVFAGRVQDLPDQQPQQHVPYSEHVKLAEALAATASAQMPSLVCTVAQTNAAARAAAVAAEGDGNEEEVVASEASDDEGAQPPAQRQRTEAYSPTVFAPRERALPVRGDGGTVNVKYCMRAEEELPNRTVVNGRFQVCDTCLSALRGGRVPAASLAVLDPGDVPSHNHLGHALLPPTHVEAIIISRARTVLRVFVLRNAATAGWRGNDTLPTVLRGHSIAFPNPDLGELRRRIPYAPEELSEFLQVLLLDAVTDRADLERKIRRAKCLQIRGAVVAAWLEHAEHTQPGIYVDAALVQAYRRMGMVPTVPDALIAHAVAAHDARMAATLNAAFESDRTGNAAVRQQQAGFEAAARAALSAEDAPQAAAANVASGADAHTAGLPEMCLHGTAAHPRVTIVQAPAHERASGDTAVADQPDHLEGLDEMEVHYGDARNTDVGFSALDGDGTVEEVIAALRASGAVAIAAGGSGVSPLNDYAPAHFNHCHLDVFPFGLDGSIPLGMSFEFWASVLVRRAPRVQFGGNATFLAHLFDVYMKHAGNTSVNVAVKISPGVLRGADSLDEKVVREVALVLCAKNNDRTWRDLLERVGQPAFDLARSLRRVAAPIELTDPFYNRWLSRTVAAEHMVGPITFTFNVNPSDMHSHLVARAAGKDIPIDPDTGRPTNVPRAVELWRQVAANPVACASLLAVVRDAINWHILGFKHGATRQTNLDCWAGEVLYGYTKVEQSLRVALHFHGGALVATFAVDRLRQLFVGPNCAALALAYSLVSMHMPTPYRSPPIITHAFGVSETEALEADEADTACPAAAYDFLTLADTRNGQRDPQERLDACKHHHCRVIKSSLHHSHTHTCQRHGTKGVDGDCAMVFPRVFRLFMRWVGVTGMFLLPRMGINVVPHLPAIALAFGCNQLTSLTCELDPDYTPQMKEKLEAWEALPEAERGECPLGRAEDHARDAGRYATAVADQPDHLEGLDEMEVHYGDARNTDVDFSALDGDGTVDEVIAALRASGAVAIAAGGSGVSPLNDYAPAHFNHCHLDVFPFGLDGSIPLGMSFEFWASALVRRAPRVQFGGNATFLAHLFDVYMKHAGNSSVNVAVKISPGVLRGADSLDEKVIREVALVLCAKNNDRTRRDLLEKVGQPAFDLARSLRRVAAPIELTDPFYNRWLSRTVAAEHMVGPITFTFNVNPSDMHSHLVARAAGKDIPIDPDTGRPTNVPRAVELWRQVAANPVACASLLAVVRDAINWHILGFKHGATRQTNLDCWAGEVLYGYTKVEQSLRVALHFHGGALVATFAVDRLRQLFVGPNCAALALAYSLVSMHMPTPYRSPPIITHAFGVSETEALEADEADTACPAAAYDFLTLADTRNGQRDPQERLDACKRHHCRVIKSSLHHSHTHTCQRHGTKGVDGDCAMVFPRVFRLFMRWVGVTGMFLLPRMGVNVVPHLPAIALAFGCNQLTSLTCELDRDYTPQMKEKLEAWEALPEAEHGECPLGRAEDHTRDAGRYATKYITKTQPAGENERVLQAACRTEAYMQTEEGQSPRLLGTEEAKSNLHRAMHVASGRHVVGLTMMAYILTGNSTFEATFRTAPLAFEPFLALALDGNADTVDSRQQLADVGDGLGYKLVSDLCDYLHRGPELCGVDCSWFLVRMNYEHAVLPEDARDAAPEVAAPRRRGHPPAAANADAAPARGGYYGAYGDAEDFMDVEDPACVRPCPLTNGGVPARTVRNQPPPATGRQPPAADKAGAAPARDGYHGAYGDAEDYMDVEVPAQAPLCHLTDEQHPPSDALELCSASRVDCPPGTVNMTYTQHGAQPQTLQVPMEAYESFIRIMDERRPSDECVGVSLYPPHTLHRRDLTRLWFGAPLNFTIVDAFLQLLQRREVERCTVVGEPRRFTLLDASFYTKLVEDSVLSCERVERWSRLTWPLVAGNVLDARVIIVPINLSNHWLLTTLDLQEHIIRFYDSLNVSSVPAAAGKPCHEEPFTNAAGARAYGTYPISLHTRRLPVPAITTPVAAIATTLEQPTTQHDEEMTGSSDCADSGDSGTEGTTDASDGSGIAINDACFGGAQHTQQPAQRAAGAAAQDAQREAAGAHQAAGAADAELNATFAATANMEWGAPVVPRIVRFQPSHPLYETHCLRWRPQPLYIQFIGKLPLRPAVEDDSTKEDAERYYAFVLGTFAAYRSRPTPPGHSLREVYDAWRRRLRYSATGRRYLDMVDRILYNIAGRAASDQRARQRAKDRKAAEAAECSSDDESVASGMEGAAVEGLQPVDTAWKPDADNFETLFPADMEPDMDAALQFDRTKPAGEYAYQAVTRCADTVIPCGHGLGAGRSYFMRRADSGDEAGVREAVRRLKDTKDKATQPSPKMEQPLSQQKESLHLTSNGLQVQACVRIVNPYNDTEPPTIKHLSAGSTVPYILLDEPPTIEQTIQLFTLASEQGVAFMQMAPCQLEAFKTPDRPRINSVDAVQRYISKDGTGGLGFDELSFISDSHWGGIAQSIRDNLIRLPWILKDLPEYNLLAGRPTLFLGDPTQHPPIKGDPVYTHAARLATNSSYLEELMSGVLTAEEAAEAIQGPEATANKAGKKNKETEDKTPKVTLPPAYPGAKSKPRKRTYGPEKAKRILYGNYVYRSFNMVFMLKKQQRQTDNASGRLLTELATAFSGGDNVQEKVERLVRELNARVVPNLEALAVDDVRVVVQRNDLHHALNTRVMKARAVAVGARVVTWKVQHSQVGGGALNKAGVALALSRDPKDFDFFTPDTVYFEGAKFVIIHNDGPVVGACRNNLVTACGLLLDAREPPDDVRQPTWRLNFPPIAVFVKPVDGECDTDILTSLADYSNTHGAFLVTPKTVTTDQIDLKATRDLGSGPVNKVKLSRRNIPLGDAYVVTDHFVQGASFKNACWVADFKPPPGGIDRASILVMLTRFKSMDHVKVLRPLYDESQPASFKNVVDAYVHAAPLSYDLKADLQRLQTLSVVTRNELAADFELMEQLIAARPQEPQQH
ncbi:hypothetical protein TSOC_012616 [Tetrabaena socialis]|uniref:Ubiquitin-like protease family profile domain-containing protein n=1 Tax=Tetrabaena socialis TaxID=47790 RepID=A0A2J7ZMK5_9CHLO|nr:hypothetical protein TSOC_012616 [Tetrabaena socialis]|eukprot:PNH01498.1 hypothetical protein TSOC_012616 [Tetrabaena socialis]